VLIKKIECTGFQLLLFFVSLDATTATTMLSVRVPLATIADQQQLQLWPLSH
jgi:hypothetical protein